MLLDNRQAVVGIDNLNPSYDVRLKDWRLDQLRRYPAFEFYRADVSDRRWSASVPADPPFRAVIHLAARAGIRQSVADPHAYFAANVDGTLNVLEWCRQRGCRKLCWLRRRACTARVIRCPIAKTPTPAARCRPTRRRRRRPSRWPTPIIICTD